MFKRLFMLGLLAIMFPTLAAANPLPAKDSSAAFATTYGFGFSQETLYLNTGNTLYEVDRSDPNNAQYSVAYSNIEDAFGDGGRTFEGSFATNNLDAGLIPFGSSGGALSVDFSSSVSMTPITSMDSTNLFSSTGRSDGIFFAMQVANDFSTSTELIRINPVSGNTQFMADPAAGSGYASGGMAMDANGNLYASSFDYTAFGDARGIGYFYRYDAADILAWETGGDAPTATLVGQGVTNGNAQLVVGQDGNIYFNTSTGIGLVDLDTGDVLNLLGDIEDLDLFSYGNTQPFNGLAVDPVTGELIFAQYDSNTSNYQLGSFVIPEPTTAMLVMAGSCFLPVRRRAGHTRR